MLNLLPYVMTRRKRVYILDNEIAKYVKRSRAGMYNSGEQSWGRRYLFTVRPSGVRLIILLIFNLKEEFHGIFERADVNLLSLPNRIHLCTMSKKIIEVDRRLTVMLLDDDRRFIHYGLVRPCGHTKMTEERPPLHFDMSNSIQAVNCCLLVPNILLRYG